MDDYEIEKKLGSGGFGTAYLVTRKSDYQQFVAKRVCLDAMKAEQKQSALNEAMTLGAMKHSNIVTFQDFFKERANEQDFLYIIMEHCAGGCLRSRISKQDGKPFPLDLIKQWFYSICNALEHMHRRNVMHRDLKPENVFLTAGGVVKIGDFGIAVVTATTAAAGKTSIGTITHQAPETLNDDDDPGYDHRCDLWSLGVVLYELLSLRLPFQAKNVGAVTRKICSGKYDPLEEGTPQELRQLIQELLNTDPSKRPECKDILQTQSKTHDKNDDLKRRLDECIALLEQMDTLLKSKDVELNELQARESDWKKRLEEYQANLENKDSELQKLTEESQQKMTDLTMKCDELIQTQTENQSFIKQLQRKIESLRGEEICLENGMNNYEKLEILGAGAFGHAIKMRHKISGSVVVAKQIPMGSLCDSERKTAQKEVLVHAALRHPNIVDYIDSHLDDHYLTILMEFVDDGDLMRKIGEKIGSPARFKEEQIWSWFVQIVYGLHYIHSKDIVHRDIKPDNMLVNTRGQVKICDFGLATVIMTTTSQMSVFGTYPYSSPELFEGERHSNASDIWALGIILYYLAALKLPFYAPAPMGYPFLIIKGVYEPLPATWSSNMRQLVAGILVKDVAKRPTCKDLLGKAFLSTFVQKWKPTG